MYVVTDNNMGSVVLIELTNISDKTHWGTRFINQNAFDRVLNNNILIQANLFDKW